MKLCLKQKGFSEFFNAIRNVYKYLNILKKRMTLIDYVFPKLATAKDVVT